MKKLLVAAALIALERAVAQFRNRAAPRPGRHERKHEHRKRWSPCSL